MATPSAPSAESQTLARRAYRSVPAICLFLVIAIAGLAGDLLSKRAAFDALLTQPADPGGQVIDHPVDVSHGFLSLHASANPGIVFGIRVPHMAVGLATAAAVIVVLFLFATSPAGTWWLHSALAMVLAGALGNAYDRLFVVVRMPYDGAEVVTGRVRDFIQVIIPVINYEWPVFNVADVLLVVGVCVILAANLFAGKKKAESKEV